MVPLREAVDFNESRILFRCDAGTHIGTGHLMRCLTLAQVLRELGAECHFACRAHANSPHKLVAEKGFRLLTLPLPKKNNSTPKGVTAHAAWLGVTTAEDVRDTINAATSAGSLNWRYDWLIVDHYALDSGWEKPMRSQARNILAIDDLADRPHDCDLLLDQNLGSNSQRYDNLVPSNCQRLIGPDYALLRPEFNVWREPSIKRRIRGQLKSLVIGLGGIDSGNLSSQILQALFDTGWTRQLQIKVLLGATSPNVDAVQRKIKTLNTKAGTDDSAKPQVSLAQGINNVAEQLAASDLAIGAAGTMSWERCCLGVPSIVVVLADNQAQSAHALEQQGAIITINPNSTVSSKTLAVQLDAALSHCRHHLYEMSNNAIRVLDGNGAQRVAARMLSI